MNSLRVLGALPTGSDGFWGQLLEPEGSGYGKGAEGNFKEPELEAPRNARDSSKEL